MQTSITSELLFVAQLSPHQCRDLLVAFVAIGLGLSIFYVTMTNYSRCIDLGSVRMIEQHFGRSTARTLLYLIGSLCLFMGLYLLAQVSLNRKLSESPPLPNELSPSSIVGLTRDTR